MSVQNQRFVDNSLEAYWRLSEELGDSSWGKFLAEWVIESRQALDVEPVAPIINPVAGFVIIPKRNDFKARAYHERLENLTAHKIYTDPCAAEGTMELKATVHEDCFDFAIEISELQRDLAGIIEARIANQAKFLIHGGSMNTYLSFWIKNNVLFSSQVNEWPSTKTLEAGLKAIQASIAELAYYEKELGIESMILPDEFWSDYSKKLGFAAGLADWIIDKHQTSLKVEEMPEALRKMIERDKAKLKTEFSRDGSRGLW